MSEKVVLFPAAIQLSKAVWLTSYPYGPTETEYDVASGSRRAEMAELLPAALVEWTQAGFDVSELVGIVDNPSAGYRAAQARIASYDNAQDLDQGLSHGLRNVGDATYRLMSVAAAELHAGDKLYQVLRDAENALNQAGWQGHVEFFGKKRGRAGVVDLPRIPRTYFRHTRIFFCELDYANYIKSDPHDDAQRGDPDYEEVEVSFKPFSRWMLATRRWREDHETSSLATAGALAALPEKPVMQKGVPEITEGVGPATRRQPRRRHATDEQIIAEMRMQATAAAARDEFLSCNKAEERVPAALVGMPCVRDRIRPLWQRLFQPVVKVEASLGESGRNTKAAERRGIELIRGGAIDEKPMLRVLTTIPATGKKSRGA